MPFLNNSITQLNDHMNKLQLTEDEKKEFISPQADEAGHYETSNTDSAGWFNTRIFLETQLKRFLRWLTSLPLIGVFFNWLFVTKAGMKLAYFSLEEDKYPELYVKSNSFESEFIDKFSVRNLGHATQFIQTAGLNVLTDPIFGHLAPIIYTDMTKHFGQSFDAKQLPRIDVILISHRHRDHVDKDTLQELIKNANRHHWPLPIVLVPKGDEDLFREFGFTCVHSFEWHQQLSLHSPQTKETVTFRSVPADHCAGLNGFDSHQSSVTGWLISPENEKEILYFAGDTAKLSSVRIKSLAYGLYQLYQQKGEALFNEKELPKLINMAPAGPNYTRRDMKPTHQSAVDGIVSAFRLAVALEEISVLDNKSNKSAAEWLNATATVFMHHNQYELGPDRFNESVFIFNRLLSYLKMDDAMLLKQAKKQLKKSAGLSLFQHRKDFIIDGVYELKVLAQQIWPEESPSVQKTKIIDFIQSRTHFPLIREKMNGEDMFQYNDGELSTFVPDTRIPGQDKLKGEKKEMPSSASSFSI